MERGTGVPNWNFQFQRLPAEVQVRRPVTFQAFCADTWIGKMSLPRGGRSKRRITRLCRGLVVCVILLLYSLVRERAPTEVEEVETATAHVEQKVLVTYAYSEGLGNGGLIDVYNFNYFIIVALSGRAPGTQDPLGRVDYNFVVSGKICSPCKTTLRRVKKQARWPVRVTVMYRKNFGMDFGAYNTSLTWSEKRQRRDYKYFVFINSSLRGPFLPKWVPPQFHFTDVLLNFLRHDTRVKLAGSYISCLPSSEPIAGPVLESLFFAVDNEALDWLIQDGIFVPHKEKAQTALNSEYGLARSITRRGARMESLNMAYASGLDWLDRKHHHCNDNRHSSRRGILEGNISPDPLAHVFVKASWCVRAKEIEVMSSWLTQLSYGHSGTKGRFDQAGYEQGISVEGTSSKAGTLPPDIPSDGCVFGKIEGLIA